ncbi:PREDICTED: uncharacterized protein LOC109585718 [Amphimedon queenslandica]|nr:PREDICTED: uncharacterized protein LOC109585718 [Amphimedon queenslandica]|eukprot:XP_019857405.1 PREDICTED: uncharacterized protein LOC109585718 [Amphimedon queenslandica]
MIGCMSFLVGDLIGPNKQVNGWYQLLDEGRGFAENVPVPHSLVSMGSQSSLSSTVSAPPSVTKCYAVMLIRGPKGYGFKVTPSTPVYINEVTQGMPAHESELQVGDLIVEIDGTDVTKSNGDMVANMIKKKRESIHLLLQRTTCSMSPTQQLHFSLPLSSSQPYLAHTYTEALQSPSTSSNDGSNGHRSLMYVPRPIFSSQKVLVPTLGFQEKRRSSTGGLTQPIETMYYDSEQVHPHPPQWGRASSRDKVTLSRDWLLPEVPEETSQSSVGGVGGGGGGEGGREGERVPAQVLSTRRLSQQDDQNGGLLHSRHSLSQPSFETRSLSPIKLYKGDPNGTGGAGGGGRKFSNNSSLGSPSEEELEGGLYGLAMQSYASSRLIPGSVPPPSGLRSAKFSSTSVTSNDSAYITETDILSHHSSCDIRDKSLAMDTAQQHIYPASTGPGGAATNGMGSSGSYSDIAVEWDCLSKLEQKRQRAINSLIKCEKEFCDELMKGIKLYLTPLSSGVLSENSHRTIFMNIERMCDLSKYFLSNISARCVQWSGAMPSVPFYVENFADIYCGKLDLFKQIFSGYLRNSENSRKEIAVAFTIPEFKRIVQDPVIGDSLPSIYSFVEAGTEYLPKMSRLLVNISYVTPLHSEDHQYLVHIISSLLNILPPSCSDLCQNWMSEIRTMEKLKSTISFGNEIESFDLLSPPGRVLLHEDEIQIFWKKKKKKAFLLLFSDLLLVTKKSGRGLSVLEPPLALQDLTVNDINCGQEEFQVVSSDGSYSRLLRASSLQTKNQWMQKLRERVGGSIRVNSKPTGNPKAKDTIRQRELKNELFNERRSPFRVLPSSRQSEDSPIRTLNSNMSVTTGRPVQSPLAGSLFDVLPSKFVAKTEKKEVPSTQERTTKPVKLGRKESMSPKGRRSRFAFGRRWSTDSYNLSQEVTSDRERAVEKKKMRRRGESLSQPVAIDSISFIG